MAKKDGHWMEKAFANAKGQLRRETHTPAGKKISETALNKAENSKNPTERKRANLAEIARRANKGK